MGHDADCDDGVTSELKMEIIETFKKTIRAPALIGFKQICYLGKSSWNMRMGYEHGRILSQQRASWKEDEHDLVSPGAGRYGALFYGACFKKTP